MQFIAAYCNLIFFIVTSSESLRKMLDVVCIGEILVDMIPSKPGSYVEVPSFLKNFGGAPFNVAIGVSRLGKKAGAIAAVGSDPFGEFLIHTLKENSVDTSQIAVKRARTTLAFVQLEPSGERSFFFYREPWVLTADTMLSPEDVDPKYVAQAKILHTSGVALTSEPERSAVFKAIKVAKEHGVMFAFDPNLRLDLWREEEKMCKTYERAFKVADIIFLAREEAEYFFGTAEPRSLANQVLNKYSEVKYVALKLGAKGAYVRVRDGEEAYEPAFKVKVVDTTGAGDAWAAAFEVALLERMPLKKAIRFANAVAALKCTGYGAISNLPTREKAVSFMEKYGDSVE